MRRPIALWKIAAAIVGGLSLTVSAAFLAIQFIQAPIAAGTVDPLRLNKTEFRDRGLFKTGDTTYILRFIAKEWVFDAGQQRDQPFAFTLPAGSTVTIIATSMEAELVSIGGVYRTFEDGWPKELKGQAVQVLLQDERLELRLMALK
jgi:hypothetical protein